MLRLDPSKRLTLEEILDHPWMLQFNKKIHKSRFFRNMQKSKGDNISSSSSSLIEELHTDPVPIQEEKPFAASSFNTVQPINLNFNLNIKATAAPDDSLVLSMKPQKFSQLPPLQLSVEQLDAKIKEMERGRDMIQE